MKRYGLENLGLANLGAVHWNCSVADLEAFSGRECGDRGRSLKIECDDRFIARETFSDADVWWGEYNRPFNPANFSLLLARVLAFLQKREVFVTDCMIGRRGEDALRVRIITETARQALEARRYFGEPNLEDFVPEFSLISVPSFHASPEIDSTSCSCFSILNLESRIGIVGGDGDDSGEIRNSIFRFMSFVKPPENVLPLKARLAAHADGRSFLFFGLKAEDLETVRSCGLTLLGDDEQLWDEHGVSPVGGVDSTVFAGLKVGHPSRVLIVSRDTTGVLPGGVGLDVDQARFFFVSGFEGGASFNPCFASCLLTRDPLVYGGQFKRKLERYAVKSSLLNPSALSLKDSLNSVINEHHENVMFSSLNCRGSEFALRLLENFIARRCPAPF